MTPPTCVITGASTGIGEACALRLDRAGWRVFAGVRRAEDAARLEAQLSTRSRPLLIDVTDPASIASAVAEIGSANASRRGVPPDNVAVVVEHALTSPAPRSRYLVGADAKLRARIGAFVPDRLRDRLFTRVLGLPSRGSFEGAVR